MLDNVHDLTYPSCAITIVVGIIVIKFTKVPNLDGVIMAKKTVSGRKIAMNLISIIVKIIHPGGNALSNGPHPVLSKMGNSFTL